MSPFKFLLYDFFEKLLQSVSNIHHIVSEVKGLFRDFLEVFEIITQKTDIPGAFFCLFDVLFHKIKFSLSLKFPAVDRFSI